MSPKVSSGFVKRHAQKCSGQSVHSKKLKTCSGSIESGLLHDADVGWVARRRHFKAPLYKKRTVIRNAVRTLLRAASEGTSEWMGFRPSMPSLKTLHYVSTGTASKAAVVFSPSTI
jgi:hypothetical protein